jgi:acetyl/propionyl-CoA carboxylase alpha subunit
VQVIADSKGNTVHLFERECSIQRRYQKIVEETPSPALDDKLRKEICESAVKIAQGIGYENAGTVEFILDNKKNFYFLEMNTRLQVEHPITEMITGVDLVKEQIRVAQGDKLRFTQEDIKSRGHALELRIYAEDPDNDFLPTNGTIQKIGKTDLNNVRLDTGYTDGSEVSTQFDPMLAKLITYSEDRDENINKMLKALEDYQFGGVVTNRDYLKRILENKNFKAGKVTTDFVKVENLEPPEVSDEQMAAAIAMSFFEEKGSSSKVNVSIEDNAWDKLNGMRLF